jgi:CelD/BcsL family acetyltransferase involved in cellulose biosynthesis
MTYTTKIITTLKEFENLRPAWELLHTLSISSAPVLSWKWSYTWWEIFGEHVGAYKSDSLRIIAVFDKNTLIGLLPLYLHRESPFGNFHLSLISTGEPTGESTFPEYTNILCLPGRSRDVLLGVSKILTDKKTLLWDVLTLGLTENGSLLDILSEYITPRSFFIIQRTPFNSWIASLVDGFEAYLSKLGTSRRTCRRILRAISSHSISLSIAKNAEETKEALDLLIKFHQIRWKKKGESGSFSTERIQRFHHTVVERSIPIKEVVFTTLKERDKPFAVIYGWRNKKKFENYQSGIIDPVQLSFKSPGLLAHLLTIKELADNNTFFYDFLAGDAMHKEMLSHTITKMVSLRFIAISTRTIPDIFKKLQKRVIQKKSIP